MKFPIVLFVVATVMLLGSIGIRMHAQRRYMDKLYYHSVYSGLYEVDEVLAERKVADRVQLGGILTATAGTVWFVVVKLRRGG